MINLHPGTKWLFRLRGYSAVSPLIFIAVVFFLVPIIVEGSLMGVAAFLIVFLVLFIPIVIISEIYARMSYNRWKYEITKDGIRMEKGIIWKKYTSIPFERVQNVNLHRGIIARILGFTTVDIETAGQSSWGGVQWGRHQRYTSEGHIPGVAIDEAEKIRNYVMKRITHSEGGL